MEKVCKMNRGERIKALREKKGITLEELGEKLGVAKQTVGKYESGLITNIPSDKIEIMAEIFEVSPAYIMGWKDKDEIPKLFTNASEARRYLSMHTIFGSDGLNVSKLNDEDAIEFANELMRQMEIISYKFKK